MQKAIDFNVAAIVSVNGSDYRINFWYMSKDDAINIMKNFDLNKLDNHIFFTSYKNEWKNLLSKNRKAVLNRAKEY